MNDWYTLIESNTIYKFKNVVWQSSQKMCFVWTLVDNTNVIMFLKRKSHYHMKEEEIYKWALIYLFNFLLFSHVS